MKIVQAAPDQAAQLTDITMASKRYWRYPEHWIELWRPLLTITSEYIVAHEVHVLHDDTDEPIGFYALREKEDALELDHLWITPTAIGRGYGRTLFQHAIERAHGLSLSSLEIEADPNARGFYERLGAYQIGEHYTEIDGQARVLPVLRFELV